MRTFILVTAPSLLALLYIPPVFHAFQISCLPRGKRHFVQLSRRPDSAMVSSVAPENDPFALFGSDDESDKEGDDKPLIESAAVRDPSNGALIFHQGTEQALLQFVRNQLRHVQNESNQPVCLRETVLRAMDQFCRTKHWMMHVGDEKGPVLQDFLAETMASHRDDPTRADPFILVEIGTYCGYSLIRMIDTLINASKHSNQNASPGFHLITADVSAQNQAVAKEMATLAGVQEYVTFLHLRDPETIPNQLSKSLSETMHNLYPDRPLMIDFLFIDHEKGLYLSDLLQLERAKLIKAKSRVCADNVVFFQLHEYREYMQKLEESGIVQTRLEMAKLEYLTPQDEDLADGLELTVYLKDPV